MTITKTLNNENTLLSLSGRLDTITSNSLSGELEKVFEEKPSCITIDFNELEYISSAGLRVLIDAQKKANSAGTKLVITGANDNIKGIFEITGFSKILTIE